MSKSYKKVSIIKDNSKSSKWYKNQANRRIRYSNLDFPKKSNSYKKCYESWDIHDYILRYSKKEAIYFYTISNFLHEDYTDLDDYLNRYWKIHFKCK